jgi:hypothetical protein
MSAYTDFVALVRDWAERDSSVLSDTRIQEALRYAADKAYRRLRISALEQTVTYNSTALAAATTAANINQFSKTDLVVPSDLIEFIQIREIDSNGMTTRVFNERNDLRTFNDPFAVKYDLTAFFTRQGKNLILSPGFGDSSALGVADKIEIQYYRRLPALDALYTVNAANYNANLLVSSTNGATGQDGSSAVQLFLADGVAYDSQSAAAAAGGTQTNGYFLGKEVYHWLRDDNSRILLYGALAENFTYLKEPELAQQYMTMFFSEIQELNDEEAQRATSGGNVQVNYSAGGLI